MVVENGKKIVIGTVNHCLKVTCILLIVLGRDEVSPVIFFLYFFFPRTLLQSLDLSCGAIRLSKRLAGVLSLESLFQTRPKQLLQFPWMSDIGDHPSNI